MQAALDDPVAPLESEEPRRIQLFERKAADQINDLSRLRRIAEGFSAGFLPSKYAITALLVIFSREAIRRAGSGEPVTLFYPSPESNRVALFEVEPPFAAL
jgi:hypothetical protein